MFKNEYQGGAFVEIFSAQGKNPGAQWKILGSPSVIWKEFDKEVKSFVFVLEGSSQTNKIQLPKENKQILGLIQRFLVLQIYIPLGQDFSAELLITDLGNIKRRLYLSTVHKELSSTPLHAKIPLFMIRRKIWCNLCIDLAAFTSEVFKGAVFQSLDGIIVSANCKLRKIFTLKSKPQDTADKDDQFINRGTSSIRSSKNQDVCHIAFGSRVLGPPPPCGKRNHLMLSTETLRSVGSKNNRSSQQLTVEKRVHSAEMSALLMPETEERRERERARQVKPTARIRADLPIMHPRPPQELSADKNNNRRRFQLRSTSRERTETPSDSSSRNNKYEDEAMTVLTTTRQQSEETVNDGASGHLSTDQADEWVFPERDCSPRLASGPQSAHPGDQPCSSPHLGPDTGQDREQDHCAEETRVATRDVFTFASRPRSAPHGKTQSMSPEGCPFILDLEEDTSVTRIDSHLEGDFYAGDSSEEEYNWRNYQSSEMSESELQMLASLRRQQNEDLEDPGAPHGLSASQVDNCNVSISSSSDDTTTWNSCLPPPVNQGRHYQKEMNPPSPSNPRDWLSMLSPPIVPPGRRPLEQHLDSSGSLSTQGEEDLSVEEDEEVLTLLYDPCLNCYFDPQTGKYYELV
ncbi:uncharacterized protein C3orf67 homolog isoform X6 [Octodon degus]|uniref:Uncharacterized protein C3orf67 homolog isoform X6 n=1 Tax=Octodon degus TaxID=10160 RepID=A0A6P6EHQ6_OCTDE|nr:uncharacterized protein C3orf67 homolog isoform X6 [Octodon degus]